MIVDLAAVDPALLGFGRRLRAARVARGLDLDVLAERAQVARLALALAEQGRGRLASAEVYRVTNALGLSLSFLFTEGADGAVLRRFNPQA